MVCTRLHSRLSSLGLVSVEQYCDLLKSNRESREIDHLIDAVSTNFTSFFREIEHFRFLKDLILPEFIAAKQRHDDGPFRAWSAGCATGEEAYSLAITLSLAFRSVDPSAWTITGTDVSTRVLDRAAEGIYEESRVKLPNPAWLARYFQKGHADWEGHYRVKRPLRDQITFEHMNLLQPGLRMSERYHLIFCRNVMIYFDQSTTELLAERLCHQLYEGGYLIIGHAENLAQKPRGLKQIKPSIFRKVSS